VTVFGTVAGLVEGRDIGRRETPVFRRAMPGHDDTRRARDFAGAKYQKAAPKSLKNLESLSRLHGRRNVALRTRLCENALICYDESAEGGAE
jgi:hypothetical protein